MYSGSYLHRDSPLHQAPAGGKLLGLAVACVVLLSVRSLWAVVAAAVAVGVLYLLARLGAATLWRQVRPLRWFVGCIFVVQWVLVGVPAAVSLTTRMVVLVALAGLVTVTTRTTDLMAALERALRPARRVVDPTRVSLLLSLVLRTVPVLADLARRVNEARYARGHRASVRAFAVPLLVGALRQADALGEALAARGFDDPAPDPASGELPAPLVDERPAN